MTDEFLLFEAIKLLTLMVSFATKHDIVFSDEIHNKMRDFYELMGVYAVQNGMTIKELEEDD